MALNSTRGRLSKNNKFVETGDGSFISKFGVRPLFYKKNDFKSDKTKNTDYLKKHIEYEKNERAKIKSNKSSYFRNLNDDEYDDTKKKINLGLIIPMIVVEVLSLILVISYGSLVRVSKKVQDVQFKKTEVINKKLPPEKITMMKGYKTAVVFGVDSRSGSVGKGTNADVIIIVNFDREKKEVQLASIYRDTFVNINGTGNYGKINAAYSKGGPEGALKTINENFDLNITDFFTFNWKAVVESIDLLGGIDIEITNTELKDLNPYIWDTGLNLGMTKEEVFQHLLISAGEKHLDGLQATAYSRLRRSDNDLKRTDRQRKVIEQCIQKAKQMDLDTVRKIINQVLPLMAHSFDTIELFEYVGSIKSVKLTAMTGFPETANLIMQDMGKHGNCIVPNTLTTTVKKMHKLLYNEDDYEPTNTVKAYSNRITELRREYKEEADRLAMEMESEEESSDETKSSNQKPKINSTSSTARPTKPKIDITDFYEEEDYESEPEEDEEEGLPIDVNSVSVGAPYENPKRAVSDKPKTGPGGTVESVNITGPMNTEETVIPISPYQSVPIDDSNLPITETTKIPTPADEMPTSNPIDAIGDVSIVSPPMSVVVDIPY